MKKKLLAAAVAATLGHGVAQAANLNPDGLGQVLIYPYYTVQEGQQTLISITNTTDQTKAVKIRFLEAKNSQEVLDFNIYMSPWDMWTGAIVADGETGAKFVRGRAVTDGVSPADAPFDNTCTVPLGVGKGAGQEFLTFAITDKEGISEAEAQPRVREGYVEVIEMGVVSDAGLIKAATHVGKPDNRKPADCSALDNAWAVGALFHTDGGVSAPTGGLYGEAHLVNVIDGRDYSYDAVAIDGFRSAPLHTDSGSLRPSLIDSLPATSYVFNGVDVVQSHWLSGNPQTISALFMHKTVMNDFVTDPTTAALTDLVVTFPTKNLSIENATTTIPPLDPFTVPYDTTTQSACEEVAYQVYSREEDKLGVSSRTVVSPRPPSDPRDTLCWEANVVTIDKDGLSAADASKAPSALKASLTKTPLDLSKADWTDGWVRIDLTAAAKGVTRKMTSLPGQGVPAVGGHNYFGLPTVGFAVQFHKNNNVDGKLSQYGALFQNKNSTAFGGADGRAPLADSPFSGS